MHICTDIAELRRNVQAWKKAGERVALVPTMGNLHRGHLRLVQAAKQHAQRVVVSVFVNPLQFNEAADFKAYPRTLDDDAQQLRAVATDLLFAPDVDVIYPRGQAGNTKVLVPGISDVLEGEHRPGHFTGVATVVAKLFNMVQPDVALFGEKDFQQLLLIRRMAADLDLPIEIISVATEREADGLAMSSRNSRLSAEQRQLAPVIYQTLRTLQRQLVQGDHRYTILEQQAVAALNQAGFRAEYVAVRRAADLQPATPDDTTQVVLLAAWLGQIRLIDNLMLALNPR